MSEFLKIVQGLMSPRKRIKSASPLEDIEDLTLKTLPMWRQQFNLISKMRKEILPPAPVDVIGCDRLADPDAPPKVKRFQTLVALMLSSQTRDAITADAMNRLKAGNYSGLTPESIVKWSEEELAECLKPVGFYRQKAKHLKQTAAMLIDKFDGDIPSELEDLISLPGVGPKMVKWN